jgi:hypothetical protein
VIAKDVGYAFESDLVDSNRAEPAFPPPESRRHSTTELLLARREPTNQALQLDLRDVFPMGYTKQV